MSQPIDYLGWKGGGDQVRPLIKVAVPQRHDTCLRADRGALAQRDWPVSALLRRSSRRLFPTPFYSRNRTMRLSGHQLHFVPQQHGWRNYERHDVACFSAALKAIATRCLIKATRPDERWGRMAMDRRPRRKAPPPPGRTTFMGAARMVDPNIVHQDHAFVANHEFQRMTASSSASRDIAERTGGDGARSIALDRRG